MKIFDLFVRALLFSGMCLVSQAAIDRSRRALEESMAVLLGEPNSDGKYISQACVLCDRLLRWNDRGAITDRRLASLEKHLAVKEDMHADLADYYTLTNEGTPDKFKNYCLSPKSVRLQHTNPRTTRATPGFRCCRSCDLAHCGKKVPQSLSRFCIANGMAKGVAPPVLSCLNDVEITLLSQNWSTKHLFTFFGGCHQSIRGWHSMYRSNVPDVAAAMHGVGRFSVGDAVSCVISGPFTPRQLSIVRAQTKINRRRVLEAMEWLKKNNRLYSDINIPKETEILDPIIIEDVEPPNGTTEGTGDSNIEERIEYTVVFPTENDIRRSDGGLGRQEDLKEHVLHTLHKEGGSATLRMKPTAEDAKLYDGEELLRGFPLVFPYGEGSRFIHETNSRNNMSRQTYYRYLSRVADPHVHKGNFVLALHSLFERQRLVRSAYITCSKKHGDDTYADMFADMTVGDMEAAVDQIESAGIGTYRVKRFVRSLEAVCGHMAHSNGAADIARNRMYAMTAHFGLPSAFFTVTPEDDGNFRIRINAEGLSCVPPETNDCKEAMAREDARSIDIRFRYPGLCAFDFDNLLEIIIEHVLGWDEEAGRSSKDGGAFGKPLAYAAAVEEQGRKTLHFHCLLWITGWKGLLQRLYSSNVGVRSSAASELKDYVDKTVSTEVFGGNRAAKKAAISHECSNSVRSTKLSGIKCTDEQTLRNMRHKHYLRTSQKQGFLHCETCGYDCIQEQMVSEGLKAAGVHSKNQAERDRQSESERKARLKLQMARHNAGLTDENIKPTWASFLIKVARNLHEMAHRSSCFKKNCHECRFNIPFRSCSATKVHFYENDKIRWASWDGATRSRAPFYIEHKRDPFDVFANCYHQITSDVLACNSNISIAIDGAGIMYCTGYAGKRTHSDDTEVYQKVCHAVCKQLSKRQAAQSEEGGADASFADGFKILLNAVLTNTSNHVISAPLAHYILNHGSRFRFSHTFGLIPWMDLFQGNAARFRLLADTYSDAPYLLALAYDYWYRPKELEGLSAHEFYTSYEKTSLKNDRCGRVFPFCDGHPEHRTKGIAKSRNATLASICHHDLEDAINQDGQSLLDVTAAPYSASMEDRARKILVMFVPYRNLDDLKTQKSYVRFLQDAVSDGLINDGVMQILGNMQDCRNSLNSKCVLDPLTRNTRKPEIEEDGSNKRTEEETLKREEADRMAALMAILDESHDKRESWDGRSDYTSVSLDGLINRLQRRRSDAVTLPTPVLSDSGPIFTRGACGPVDIIDAQDDTENTERVTQPRLIDLAVTATARHVGNDASKATDTAGIVANGTVESINMWAEISFTDKDDKGGQPDADQVRVFQILAANFVLTYHDEAAAIYSHDEAANQQYCEPPRNKKIKLWNVAGELRNICGLKDQTNDPQLLLFLTGAGGSGKSRVIEALLCYAKAFCKELRVPFTKRTITVTAMTGVAATSILGETIHSAAGLNKNEDTLRKDIEEWKDCRLLVLDEISFASQTNLKKIHHNLEFLRETRGKKYGGLSVVFAGDFYQLPPVGDNNNLYMDEHFIEWYGWINMFYELKGRHRYSKDPLYGEILERFRRGVPTKEDFVLINDRLVYDENGRKTKTIPKGIQVATYANKTRNSINANMLRRHLQETHSKNDAVLPPLHTIVIRAGNPCWVRKRKKPVPFSAKSKRSLFENCGDCDVRKQTTCTDPMLTVYNGVPLMLTDNRDVCRCQANGTFVRLKRVVLEPDAHVGIMKIDGYRVHTVDACHVQYLICEHMDADKYEEPDVRREPFRVYAKNKISVRIDMPLNLVSDSPLRKRVSASLYQFPLLVNYATTVHKLQGLSVDRLYVAEWRYCQNWIYVVLSRIRTLGGLFLHLPLDEKKDYRPDPRIAKMIATMSKKKPKPIHADIYKK